MHLAPLSTPSLLVMSLAIIGLAGVATAGDTKPPKHGAPVPGVAHLSVIAEGAEVRVDLASPAATLVGFARSPKTDAERETLNLAKANLNAGDAMIRFNTQAGCRPVEASVKADFGKPAEIRASYRFSCDQPDRLDSAALGLFMGFPALRRVLVRYTTKDGQGGAELTPVNAVVTFVPLPG
ncbi:ZrgA family zinc uptake protein [Thiobaca trueperi]|uniref:Uncharacterized protein DUF2796 n=1 Tax=Thiobaca trueperi TaxID=127458 RepID=A0A4V2V270_9GAMM|nr:DUF2796 domain-containing protein [Thiobaca trueperi]TCT23912.1 uncharacterized protein DUF2796 [Thiobaca trueperi]